MREIIAKTCHISTNAFEVLFTRMNKKKWINQPRPSGICNVVTAVILERQDDTGVMWTYTQTRVAVDDDAAVCKGFELNKPLTFTSGGSSAVVLDCSGIDTSVF
ncbi:hypothetical protein D7X32_21080 [Corallococcus carmarthensis]|uniref:Uncharacterized protein n=2 Tax=Corallococcus carmarthensis TaxID=2316728 RepID=A0A3A8KA70_9BACT|nr:hypothetical protein D7X32_21080 [Corallococcus carmarthensis]